MGASPDEPAATPNVRNVSLIRNEYSNATNRRSDMQTDQLISLMVASQRPVDTARLSRATWLAALCALAVTAGLVLITLGPRHDLGRAWLSMPVLAKMLLGAGVAAIALPLFQRSLRPGQEPARQLPWVLAPILLVVGWAALTLAQTPAEQWTTLIFGHYWRACLVAVPLYAMVPFLVLLMLARRGRRAAHRGMCRARFRRARDRRLQPALSRRHRAFPGDLVHDRDCSGHERRSTGFSAVPALVTGPLTV